MSLFKKKLIIILIKGDWWCVSLTKNKQTKNSKYYYNIEYQRQTNPASCWTWFWILFHRLFFFFSTLDLYLQQRFPDFPKRPCLNFLLAWFCPLPLGSCIASARKHLSTIKIKKQKKRSRAAERLSKHKVPQPIKLKKKIVACLFNLMWMR